MSTCNHPKEQGASCVICNTRPIPVFTNDLKKGTEIKLRNGWFGTLTDNAKGNIREAEVRGDFTETGSVYSHDIMQAKVGGAWVMITHTGKQLECRKMNDAMGF
jgi:hypothetical protein